MKQWIIVFSGITADNGRRSEGEKQQAYGEHGDVELEQLVRSQIVYCRRKNSRPK